MKLTPFWRQNIILSSVIMVMFTIGCAIGFVAILVSQLQNEDSTIKININTISWIASIFGFSGAPSFLIPTLMQARGRKSAFILCDVLMIIGWSLTYFSNSIEVIILALAFIGLGLQSYVVIALLIMSEFASPQYRNFWSNVYAMSSLMGTLSMHILGMYTDWRVTILLADIPLILSLLIACFWPETPAWLAEKGRFEECASVFAKIRETGENEQKELQELLAKQKNNECNIKEKRQAKKLIDQISDLYEQIKRRDFYLPAFLIMTLVLAYYSGAGMILRVLFKEMIKQTNNTETISWLGILIVDVVLIVGVALFMFFFVNFKNKPLFLYSGLASGLLLLMSIITLFLQDYNYLAENSLVPFCFIMIFMFVYSVGLYTLPMRVSGELLPVKHRGIGGAIFCLSCFVIAGFSMKLAPYMYECLSLKFALLVYDLIIFYCMFIIWKYLPETKGKTLQQIEEFYNEPNQKEIIVDGVVYNEVSTKNIV